LLRMRWAGNVSILRKEENAYKIFIENPIRKYPIGGTRRKWENNINLDLRLRGWGSMGLTRGCVMWREVLLTVLESPRHSSSG
jgi:hypothetical protein